MPKKGVLTGCAIVAAAILLTLALLPAGRPTEKPPEAVTTDATTGEGTVQQNIFLPVVMYHSVIDNAGKVNDYVVTPASFRADMTYLQQQGYTTVFVQDILDFIDTGVTKAFLLKEWQTALEEKVTPNCRMVCAGCGAASFKGGVCIESKS